MPVEFLLPRARRPVRGSPGNGKLRGGTGWHRQAGRGGKAERQTPTSTWREAKVAPPLKSAAPREGSNGGHAGIVAGA